MGQSKKTLVLGASDNPERYSNKAMLYLKQQGHEVVALGKVSASAHGISICTELKEFENIHTITLYINPQHQKAYYNYILSLNPKRVLFNPGTENEELETLLKKSDISYMEACTLVLLNTGQY